MDHQPGTAREEGLFGPGGAKFVAVLLALAAAGVVAFVLTAANGEEEPGPIGSQRVPEPRPLTPGGPGLPPGPDPGPSRIVIPLPDPNELPEGIPPEARRLIELGRERLACLRGAEGDIDAITRCVERFAP